MGSYPPVGAALPPGATPVYFPGGLPGGGINAQQQPVTIFGQGSGLPGVGGGGGGAGGMDFSVVPRKKDGSVDYGQVLSMLLAAGALYEGISSGRKSDKLTNQATAMAQREYADRLPLRVLGAGQLMSHQAPDLSSIFADPHNPYARGRVPRVGASAATPAGG